MSQKSKKPNKSVFHKPVSPVVSSISLGIAGLLLLIVVMSRFIYTPPKGTSIVAPKMVHENITAIPNITDSPRKDTFVGIPHTYTSSALGVTFQYIDDAKQPIHIKELGDKIYLSIRDFNPAQDKYVEVFTKNPTDSLADALRKQFLQNYSPQTCIVQLANIDRRNFTSHPTYQYAQIAVIPGDAQREATEAANCPIPYTYEWSSEKYFLMDSAHPNKFAYFDLGQDNFGAPATDSNPDVSWDQILTFQ